MTRSLAVVVELEPDEELFEVRDLVANDGNTNTDIFVRDMLRGTTTRVSVDRGKRRSRFL